MGVTNSDSSDTRVEKLKLWTSIVRSITFCFLNHMQQCMFVFCGFLMDKFSFPSNKLNKKYNLALPQFANFVS
jgi:hypothetical protein